MLACVLWATIALDPVFAVCVGDCDDNSRVTVDEVVTAVTIALGKASMDLCPAIDSDADRRATVNELLRAVTAALNRCPSNPTPTSWTPTATPTVTHTAIATHTPNREGGGIVLVDRSAEAGVMTRGTACLIFRDMDQDDRPDLLIGGVSDNASQTGSLTLFHNNGDGTFRSATAASHPVWAIYGCAAGDLSGDGKSDVVIIGQDRNYRPALAYLQSIGGGQFQDASSSIPTLSPEFEGAQSIAVFDYDADGRLDIAAGAFGAPPQIDRCEATDDGSACYLSAANPPPQNPILIHNIDGTHFEPAAVVFPDPTRVNAFNFMDWDDDGFVDVFVSGDYGVNRFYRNVGGNSFVDLLPGSNLSRYNHGMGAVFGDFDDDRRWDVYVAEFGDGFLYSVQPEGGLARWSSVSMAAATRTDNIWSPVGADLDNDGHLDVFAPSGAYASSQEELYTMAKNLAMSATIEQSDCLIRNAGGGVFESQRVPNQSTIMSLFAKQAAGADYDDDGRVDIAALEPYPTYSLRLLHNESPRAGNHWIGLRLIGRAGDRDQVGATVTLFDGPAEFARRAVNSGGIGISSEVVHFGVGPRGRVDAARIRWADGTTTDLPGPLEVDATLDVHQP